MKAYLSFFRIRFINGLQYRAAAYAGIVTQLAWGFMYIMLYHAFYRSNPSAVPMEISKLSTYIWLQQSFLALFMTWFLEKDILELVSSGNVAYEMCRPLNIYDMWFMKNLATRVSKTTLRFAPILIITAFLPQAYKFNGPNSFIEFILFLVSMILGTIVVIAYCMLIYIFSFYTISSKGVEIVMIMVADFFSGGVIPLPLLPDNLKKFIYITPFASMQNAPFRIYIGDTQIKSALISIVLQLFWAIVLIFIGKIIMKKAMKKVVVQGG